MLWGRRSAASDSANRATVLERAGTSRPLGMNDLLRRAEWETMDEGTRASLLSALPALDAPTTRVSLGFAAYPDERALQDWVAGVVAPRFQPEVAAGVQAWLETAAPGGHLFVGGLPGMGRTGLVANVARQVMRAAPTPPSFCYAPDPDALDTPLLLTLPLADGQPFARALVGALGEMAQHWGDAGSHGGASALTRLVMTHMDALQGQAPASTQSYLTRLRGALDALAQAGGALPFDADHLPMGHVSPDPDATQGAPVVVVGRGSSDLADALLKANGGVLVANAGAVDFGALSSALLAGELALQDGWPKVPLDVRVALIGGGDAYGNLASEEFSRLFRYELWLNPVTAWTRETEAAYAALAAGVARRYGLPALDASGVARLIEECARRIDGMNHFRLGTDLALPHDLAAEAGRLARAQGSAVTTGAHLEAAVLQRRALQVADGRWMREAILSGAEITPTAGAAVGQINGLGVIEDHPWEAIFAVPMRISATVSPGREEQLLDIEYAVRATDADHVRGEMTAEGYLTNRYGQEQPLSFNARVRFEQEHGASGGDSASAAVLYALLSALSQTPIRRSLAVTGAVGQYGELQPIGGVNFKIEGFWELCRLRRERGEQPEGGYGVVLPAVNLRDLQLRPEVARSIAEEGWFQIYPITQVDEGIPLLMGLPAEALHQRVTQRLQRFHEVAVSMRGTR